jgi:hypothetical protein
MRRVFVWLGALAPILAVAAGCSLFVRFEDECSADSDCAERGAQFACRSHVCVVPNDQGGDGGTGDGACPTPTTNTEFLNACTNAQCFPFDDKVRVTKLGPDGSLPPVPVTDAGTGGAG